MGVLEVTNMMMARLKAKNQVTIPQQIVDSLNLKFDQLFSITLGENCIKLTPVDVAPRGDSRSNKS